MDQHKLARAKTTTKGLLSRRSVKKAQTLPVQHSSSTDTLTNPGLGTLHEHSNGKEKDTLLDAQDAQEVPRPNGSVSLIPDILPELPAWYNSDLETLAASAAHFRLKYPLHNSFGPRRYRNHHLAQPKYDNRPPSVFSPSFPPMAAASERVKDPLRLPGLSRTPSGSPLPTPSSSQSKIQDPGARVRTRKISGTDNVDLLDITDPWGGNWHHQSPYDVGHTSDRTATTPDVENPSGRARRTSLSNTGGRHKTVTPSPLSQSTSAVHLHVPDVDIPRRLSKRRKPFAGLFSNNQHASDAPDHSSANENGKLSRQISNTVLPSSASVRSAQSGLKVRRGSVLGRLAKRFSVLRRPDGAAKTAPGGGENRGLRPADRADRGASPTSNQSTPADRQGSVSPVKGPASGRRIPPPSIRDVATPATPYGPSTEARDQSMSSLSSVGSPVQGPLTLMNPDDPSESAVTSPTIIAAPLPQVQQPQSAPAPAPVSVPVPAAPTLPDRQSSSGQSSSLPAAAASPSPVVQVASNHVPSSHETLAKPPSIHEPPAISQAIPQLPPLDFAPQPVEVPQPPSSPPLPELPPATPAPIEHSLPTTPADSLPSSPTTDRRSSLTIPSYVREMLSRTATSLASIEDSPLSRASILVNPPTPYVQSTSALPGSSSKPPVPSIPEKTAPQETSPTKMKNVDVPQVKTSNLTKGRQTETFKLVRSPSGTMYSAGEIIPGMGSQWEVIESPVESPKRSKKERSTSKDEETPTRRRGSRKQERQEPGSSTEEDDEQRRRKRTSASKSTSVEYTRATRTPSIDAPRRSTAAPDRGSSSQRERRRSSAKPNSAAMANGQMSYGEHSSFVSTRPTSEFESAADINAFKAKEAWEMDRLWRARSMAYGADGASAFAIPTIRSDSRPSTIMSMDIQRPGTIPSVTDLHRATTLPAATTDNHGSTHTYYTVQTPYSQNGPHTTYNYVHPTASSPIIYAPTSQHHQQPIYAPPSHHHQQQPHQQEPQYQKAYRSFAESVPFPSSARAAPDHLAHPSAPPNLLPEPPRLSTYRPAPIPSSLSGPGSGPSSPEYWAQYAGVTTSP